MATQPDTSCALLNRCIQFLIEDMLGYNIKFSDQVPHDILCSKICVEQYIFAWQK